MLKVYPEFVRKRLTHNNHNGLNKQSFCHSGTVLQHANSSLKATVFITTLNGKCVVVKDYSTSHALIRATVCKWFMHREIAAIERLQKHPGVPKLIGRFGEFGFAMERVEGRTLDNSLLKDNAPLMQKLDQTVTTMHRYGVSHNDIRNKNLIVDREGNLFIVDFASAVIRPKYGVSFFTLLYCLSRFSDRVKIVRLKQEFSTQTLNSLDQPLLKFVSVSKFISRLWKKHVYKFLKHR